jgi:hypothetical protein
MSEQITAAARQRLNTTRKTRNPRSERMAVFNHDSAVEFKAASGLTKPSGRTWTRTTDLLHVRPIGGKSAGVRERPKGLFLKGVC